MKGWEKKRFDEFGTIFSGSTPSTSIQSFWNGEIVWVTPYDLSRLNTPYLDNSAKRISEKGLAACSATLLPAKSLVVSSRAPIGYVALPTVSFCTNQGCKTMKLKSEFDPEFAYYNVLFNIDKVKGLGEGTTFAEISKKALSTVEISFPSSKPEQTKIAEILSTVDRAIEETEALIAKQQRIMTGLMQDLLTRGIDKQGNLRAEQTHKFKDSPLGRIPVEWEASTLGKMAEFSSGYAFKNQELAEHGWRVVRISNLHKVDFPYWHYNGPIRARWIVRSGDILFSWAGVASSIDCVRYHGEDALLNQHIYNFKFPNDDQKTFVYYYLQNYLPILRTEIEGGAGQLHLTKEKIQSIGIPKLSTTELKIIVIRLQGVEDCLNIYNNQLLKAKRLKTGLMQDLLTGRKRVTSLLGSHVN
jgi:type I restriction enzyme S subunit